MAKAPAFQFYVKDWLIDAELQMCSASTRGIWINILCWMHWNGAKGIITVTEEKFLTMGNCTHDEFMIFTEESRKNHFCYCRKNVTGNMTVINRRMRREAKAKESNKLRQQKYRDKHKSNTDVTSKSQDTPSPSPSPTPKKEKRKKKENLQNAFKIFWQDYPKKKAKEQALKAWMKLCPDGNLQTEILAGIARAKDSEEWQRNNGQYIPYPATFLNNKRWEDEYASRSGQPPTDIVDRRMWEAERRLRHGGDSTAEKNPGST